jgi:dipeptidyl aminopeptidase/acylaminoacyl peptidase
MINDNNKISSNANTLNNQPELTESKNYLNTSTDNSKPNDNQQIHNRNITLKTILLHTKPENFFIKSSPKENFIAIFSARKKNIKVHPNKKFSLFFSQLDKNKQTIKTLSHPVRSVAFADDLNKVLFTSVRKKQDKIKVLEVTDYKINDGQTTTNLNINLTGGFLSDISYSNNKCFALIANQQTASIMECNIINNEPNSTNNWNNTLSFTCPDIIETIKFNEQGNFIYALLKNKKLVIYKKNTTQQKYLECKTISNMQNIPLSINDKDELLCCDNTKLFVVDCSSDNSNQNDNIDIITDLSSSLVKDACFTQDNDVIASTYDTSTKLHKVFVYKKTEDSWKSKDLSIDKNVIAMKKNLFTEEVFLFYNNN